MNCLCSKRFFNFAGFIYTLIFQFLCQIWNHPDILKSYLDSKKDTNRNDSPLVSLVENVEIVSAKFHLDLPHQRETSV